jgi:hypothetical protein
MHRPPLGGLGPEGNCLGGNGFGLLGGQESRAGFPLPLQNRPSWVSQCRYLESRLRLEQPVRLRSLGPEGQRGSVGVLDTTPNGVQGMEQVDFVGDGTIGDKENTWLLSVKLVGGFEGRAIDELLG